MAPGIESASYSPHYIPVSAPAGPQARHGFLSLQGEMGLLDPEVLHEISDAIRGGRVTESMDRLLPLLQERRLRLTAGAWDEVVQQCLRHPLREVLHQDPFTERAFTKPRGYAGDAVLLDYIYGREEGWPVPAAASELGQHLFEYTTGSSACEAVRARRGYIANLLDQLAEEVARPHVLAVAAGHLREALLSAAVKRRKLGRYVAVDADADSLAEVQHCYSTYGVKTVASSIRQLLTHKLDLGTFDLVYSTGLFDYVPAAAAQRLTSALFQMLRPRGRLVVANFLPGIPDVGYMECYMGWKLLYRSRLQMVGLSTGIAEAEIRDLHIFAGENQNIIFLQVTRR
jgi:extracellular factor (EF) 3-hydroxypalmitic acid methyl ester biosynthesis protein